MKLSALIDWLGVAVECVAKQWVRGLVTPKHRLLDCLDKALGDVQT